MTVGMSFLELPPVAKTPTLACQYNSLVDRRPTFFTISMGVMTSVMLGWGVLLKCFATWHFLTFPSRASDLWFLHLSFKFPVEPTYIKWRCAVHSTIYMMLGDVQKMWSLMFHFLLSHGDTNCLGVVGYMALDVLHRSHVFPHLKKPPSWRGPWLGNLFGMVGL